MSYYIREQSKTILNMAVFSVKTAFPGLAGNLPGNVCVAYLTHELLKTILNMVVNYLKAALLKFEKQNGDFSGLISLKLVEIKILLSLLGIGICFALITWMTAIEERLFNF